MERTGTSLLLRRDLFKRRGTDVPAFELGAGTSPGSRSQSHCRRWPVDRQSDRKRGVDEGLRRRESLSETTTGECAGTFLSELHNAVEGKAGGIGTRGR